MSSVSCTINGIDWYNSGWNNSYATSTTTYAGISASGGYYVSIIKLTTPSFQGVSKTLTVSCKLKKQGSGFKGSTLRWALASSAANRDSYRTSGEVTDANQIASGTWDCQAIGTSYTAYTATIDTTALKASTSYYFFIWAGQTNSDGWAHYVHVNSHSNHSATLDTGGVVRIRYNNSWQYAIPWVRYDDTWVEAIPWVRDDNSWKNTC